MATHKFDLGQYTYIDVKVAPVTQDIPQKVLNAAGITGMEYVGHVGELPDHLLYRIPKTALSQPVSDQAQLTDEEKNKQIVTVISAIRGVVHVEIQVPHQRFKRDEL